MKKAKEVLGIIKYHTCPFDSAVYKGLEKVKDGKLAQKFLVRVSSTGFSPEEFEKFEWTARFKRIVAAIMKVQPDANLTGALRNGASLHYRLNRLDGTIPWELYAKIFPCLKSVTLEPKKCWGKNCRFVLDKELGVLFSILLRHDILSREGGIFADRLITAIELGVPLEKIKTYFQINLSVAIEVLKEFFSDINEDKLRKLSANL